MDKTKMTNKELNNLMELDAVEWLTERPIEEALLFLQGIRENRLHDYVEAVDFFLDRIEEIDLDGIKAYFYLDAEKVTMGFIYGDYDKTNLLEHCLVDYFINKFSRK